MSTLCRIRHHKTSIWTGSPVSRETSCRSIEAPDRVRPCPMCFVESTGRAVVSRETSSHLTDEPHDPVPGTIDREATYPCLVHESSIPSVSVGWFTDHDQSARPDQRCTQGQ